LKISKNISKTIVIAIVVLLMASVILISVPVKPAQAALSPKQPYSGPLKPGDVADGTFYTEVWISIRPKVIGVGQTLLVNVWATPASNAQRKLMGYQITITKPDGTKDQYTLNSERDTAATWMEYSPDQIGEYKYKVDFPGTFCPAGYYNDGTVYTTATEGASGYNVAVTNYTGSTYYTPNSSPEYTFTVQQDMVWSYGAIALPNDYWTRNVAVELREWLPILGDWPWYGPAGPDFYELYPNDSPYWSPRTDFYPYVQGPSSAHIAWKRVQGIAGITGAGRYGTYGATEWSYEVPAATTSLNPGVITMVIGGRGYITVPRVRSQMINGSLQQVATTALQCLDIRTGEVYWEVDGFTHSQGIDSFGSWIFGGAIEYPSTIVYLDGSRLCKYNANTGAQTANVSISPLTSAIHYMAGYALGVQNLGSNVPLAQRYRLINFSTGGSSSNFTSRIAGNISWPLSSLPATTDFTAGIAVSFGSGLIGYSGTTTEQRLVTVDLKTGTVIVNKTIEPAGSGKLMGYSGSCNIVDKGIFAFLNAWGEFVGFDIRTGAIRWTSPKMDAPWDANSFGAYDTTSADGMFFRAAYSGVYAFDWETGKIVWKYEAPAISSFETPYIDPNGTTVNSFNGVAYAADGKIYTMNTEHSPTQPITRGWQLHCINATTGEGIFKTIMTGSMGAIADGYMAISESYTGTLYVLGKGKSATTVTAPDVEIEKGKSIVIKGTVLDLSPAQPGTACVSKASMSTQMEYLHKQMPIAGLWGNETINGVPVILTAIDSNGNSINIGTATTNGYYGTFSFTWTPELEGDYQILANFAGDESYGSSGASTAIVVGQAPTETVAPTATPLTMLPYEMYTIGAAAATIITIAIATVLILRKRP
jgi:hypothetical protein